MIMGDVVGVGVSVGIAGAAVGVAVASPGVGVGASAPGVGSTVGSAVGSSVGSSVGSGENTKSVMTTGTGAEVAVGAWVLGAKDVVPGVCWAPG